MLFTHYRPIYFDDTFKTLLNPLLSEPFAQKAEILSLITSSTPKNQLKNQARIPPDQNNNKSGSNWLHDQMPGVREGWGGGGEGGESKIRIGR